MKIHANKQEALTAIKEYRDAVNAISEKFGVYEECEDSYCAVNDTVKFYGDDGKTVCRWSE